MSITALEMGSREAGSCNGCDRWATEDGTRPHRVAVVRLGTTEVRLCYWCSNTMRKALNAIDAGRSWSASDA